jgi:hypothetical protein
MTQSLKSVTIQQMGEFIGVYQLSPFGMIPSIIPAWHDSINYTASIQHTSVDKHFRSPFVLSWKARISIPKVVRLRIHVGAAYQQGNGVSSASIP